LINLEGHQAIGVFFSFKMAGVAGLEPTTHSFGDCCSAS
jgi:hypothetical protein